ncbi:hypothetical protein N7535_005712 [Penicillium sp. DV-2018c]|nr:hypothetical protein N7535_005712 [Penicillium sp. DV-2018c]
MTPKRTSTKSTELFPGLNETETKLLVFANACTDKDHVYLLRTRLVTVQPKKMDYDKLAAQSGLKVSSARTLYRKAKRKITKTVEAGSNEGTSSTPAKKPRVIPEVRVPRTPRPPRALRASKSKAKTPKGEAANKGEGNAGEGTCKCTSESVEESTVEYDANTLVALAIEAIELLDKSDLGGTSGNEDETAFVKTE